MADAECFATACDALESETSFSRIEARGTVRLALKAAGLDATSVTRDQMKVVLDRVLPNELENRGIAESSAVCASIERALSRLDTEGGSDGDETPESVFSRLGGSS